MGDWVGMMDAIEAVLQSTVPTAYANGIYYEEEAVSIVRKAQSQQLPFFTWRFELEPEADGDEFGPVRILIVDRMAEGAVGAKARIAQSLALQTAFHNIDFAGGYVMGKPRIETGNGLPINVEMQAGPQELWAYGVTCQVRI